MTRTQRAPTVEDATAAAKHLAAAYEGIFVVLLHGSVARGDATTNSDIDLVAVFADLDYTSRWDLRFEMEKRVAGQAPFLVQVHPTDIPEWFTRSTRVPCSFEANVTAGSTLVVAEGHAHASNAIWQKEQKLATDNLSASLDYLWSHVRPKLGSLARSLKLHPEIASHEKLHPYRRFDRMYEIREDSSMAVEVAIKTLATLRGEHPVTAKKMQEAGHDIGLCLGQLSRPYRTAITRIITREGLDLASMSTWRTLTRIRGTSPGDIDASSYSAYEQVNDYILTSLSVTSAVIAEFESAAPANDARVTDTRREWRFTAERYDTTEPRSVEPRKTPLGITSRMEALKLEVTPGQGWLFNGPEL